MDWLDDDVVYGAACALLLMLLLRELLATVAQCVPLSGMLHWLPGSVRHVILSVEPICNNKPGELPGLYRFLYSAHHLNILLIRHHRHHHHHHQICSGPTI